MLRSWFKEWVQEGHELAKRGEYEALLGQIEEVRQQELTHEERVMLDNDRAWALLELGRGEEAVELAEAVLARVPSEEAWLVTWARGTFGAALAVAGYLEDAIEVLDEVLKHAQKSPWLASARWFYRGYALFELDRRDEARDSWRRAREVDPGGLYGERAWARLRELDNVTPYR